MSAKVKTEKNVKPEGDVITFDNEKDYVAVTLKSDGKTYVEHKLFAKTLVERKLAEYAKGVKLESAKNNTQILED